MRDLFVKVYRTLGSFGLACIILLLMMVLTLFGTLDQRWMSLYDVQKKYFESWIVVIGILPIPGAVPLMSLLSLNLLVGGLIRLRRTWSRAGIFVIHIGISILLLGSLVEYVGSNKGYVRLFEGDKKGAFQSHYEWEVTFSESFADGRERVHVIMDDKFDDLTGSDTAEFRPEGLPFTVQLSGYVRNAGLRPARPGTGVDGVVLTRRPLAEEAEHNVPGLRIVLIEDGGERHEALLWGARHVLPYVVVAGGKPYEIELHPRRWVLPFEVELTKFRRELHPRTQLPSSFSSDVTRYEAGSAEEIHIRMNEPMRHRGYTFYQSGWGPQGGPPGARMFSVLAVVENPADRVPILACVVIAIGMLWQ
ncbi:MAG: cytochrome c biogenesis protein ResB, partial [Planctomycetota bacterium]